MPFREKIKKALGQANSTSPSNPSSTLSTRTWKKRKEDEKYPDHVYRPSEPMPPLKYRGLVDRQHQKRLESFSFGSALEVIRRHSATSQYSPRGSRMPSRRGSVGTETGSAGERPDSGIASRKVSDGGGEKGGEDAHADDALEAEG